MARQDDATKLLAIGLLNFADDEGYFYACPSLVRSALRPFDDDSSIVRRSIEQLSKIGFIEVREHGTHGPVGFVVSFSDHQRVDRPKESSIKELYNSTNVRRSIDDQSSLEGKGTGKGKESVSANKSPLSFPDSFSENRKQTFLLWAKHKAEKGQSYKPTGWRQLLSSLDNMTDAQLDHAVRHSMAMNYQGIFPAPKGEQHQQGQETKPKIATAPANWQQAAEELYGQSFAGMTWETITPTQRGQIAMHINQA